MKEDLESGRTPVAAPPALQTGARASRRNRRAAIAALAAVAIVAAAIIYLTSRSGRPGLPALDAIDQAAGAGRIDDVFRLLREGGTDLNDARLASVAHLIGGTVSIETDPPSVSVAVRRVASGDPSQVSAAVSIGRTPMAGRLLVPGEYVIDLAGEGVLPVSFLARVSRGQELRLSRRLTAATRGHEQMVAVDAGIASLSGTTITTPAFLIDAYEVTNEAFARFMTSGGYANAGLWPETMVVEGRTVPRVEALRRFLDRTNLPGPRGWSGGTFPDGKAQHPVSGVSWYEAAAYGRWLGKELPTHAQWWRAAMDTAAEGFPWGTDARTADSRANFGQAGTREVGSFPSGVSPFGTYDSAGNVSEWLRDAQPGESRRSVTGGSWQDEPGMFGPSHREWFDPAYANEAIGFRLVASQPAAADTGGSP